MPTLPSKKEVLLDLLDAASVLIHLDARREDVQVPKHLKQNPALILKLGSDLAEPIQDLHIGDGDVRCTLSFTHHHTPFFCVLPYPSIFAIVSADGGRAMVWPEDVPVEVALAAEAEARKHDATAPQEPEMSVSAGRDRPRRREPSGPTRAEPPRPRLEARSRSNGSQPNKPEQPAKPAGYKRELPPYLRVIK